MAKRSDSKPRAAMFIDLENIVHPERMSGDFAGARWQVASMVARVQQQAHLIHCVAVCDVRLARELAIDLAKMGVRVFSHRGGVDAADHELLSRISHDVPSSCELVVVASGDHIFTQQVAYCKAKGLRVEVIARTWSISADLYREADEFCHLEPVTAAA
jgi:hypothetical protein